MAGQWGIVFIYAGEKGIRINDKILPAADNFFPGNSFVRCILGDDGKGPAAAGKLVLNKKHRAVPLTAITYFHIVVKVEAVLFRAYIIAP